MLDLAEVTREQYPDVEGELVDFGVVGPGPRRTLNWLHNRRWFDNEFDSTPAAEKMYTDDRRRKTHTHTAATLRAGKGGDLCADRRCVVSVPTSWPTQT